MALGKAADNIIVLEKTQVFYLDRDEREPGLRSTLLCRRRWPQASLTGAFHETDMGRAEDADQSGRKGGWPHG